MAPNTKNEPPRAVMLARRVLPINEYVEELREDKGAVAQRLKRQYGVRVVPIPVPLAPGDSEAEYEERFLKDHMQYRNASDSDSALGERAARCLFARRVAREYKLRMRAKNRVDMPLSAAREKTDRVRVDDHKKPTKTIREDANRTRENLDHEPNAKSAHARSSALETPSDVRYTKRFVELDEFKKDYKSGRFATYKTMTREEKMARFGVPIVPIFVPLARGESGQQYEERFLEWLENKHGKTLDEVRRDPNPVRERTFRLLFAGQNGCGRERFDPRRFQKRERDGTDGEATEEPSKKARRERDLDGASRCCTARDNSLDAYMECGCDACLLSAVKLWAEKAARLEQDAPASKCLCGLNRRRTPPRHAVVLDLTLDGGDDDDAIEVDTGASDSDDLCELLPSPVSVASDSLEDRLQSDFDEINEQIVLNLKALDAVVHELAATPPDDLHEMTRLHEENEEMRGLINEECGKRTTALALLVLYKWRHNRRGLEAMVNDKTASDVEHVQRRSYERLMSLANEFVDVNQKYAEPRQLIDVEEDSTEDLTTTTHARMEELKKLRYDELAVLVHFDRTLRCCLSSLLQGINMTRETPISHNAKM